MTTPDSIYFHEPFTYATTLHSATHVFQMTVRYDSIAAVKNLYENAHDATRRTAPYVTHDYWLRGCLVVSSEFLCYATCKIYDLPFVLFPKNVDSSNDTAVDSWIACCLHRVVRWLMEKCFYISMCVLWAQELMNVCITANVCDSVNLLIVCT